MSEPDKENALDAWVEDLLSSDEHRYHPLYAALAALHARNQEQLTRLERITHIADGYHAMARSSEQTMAERFNRQLRQLEKLARISDRYQEQLRDANTRLQEAATHDALTGLSNRRHMQELLLAEAERSGRHGGAFAVAMLDVDHFKQVNDRHGHDIGDRVLVAVAQTLRAKLRDYDRCGRWGGEEFIVLLPQTELEEAALVLGRMREAIGAQQLEFGGVQINVTCSVGVTVHRPDEHVDATVKRADHAMLTAKRDGRNRLCKA